MSPLRYWRQQEQGGERGGKRRPYALLDEVPGRRFANLVGKIHNNVVFQTRMYGILSLVI